MIFVKKDTTFLLYVLTIEAFINRGTLDKKVRCAEPVRTTPITYCVFLNSGN